MKISAFKSFSSPAWRAGGPLARRWTLRWLLAALVLSSGAGPVLAAGDLADLRRQAAAGNPAAQQELGVRFATGEGELPQSFSQARKWWTLAARQGVAGASYNLALMYDTGSGVQRDSGMAARFYHQAADGGLAAAQNALGRMYEMGRGVKQDIAAAKHWYRRAAGQGMVFAQSNLGFLIYAGATREEELVEAYAWLSLAADRGNAIARAHRAELATQLAAGQIAAGRKLAVEIAAGIEHRPGGKGPARAATGDR